MTTPAPDHLPTARELENVYADGLCASDWPMLNEEAAKHRRRASALERRASSENRQLLADESRTARAHTSEADKITSMARSLQEEDRLEAQADREELAKREAAAAETRRMMGGGGTAYTSPRSATYERDERGGPSFFTDLVLSKRGGWDAAQRLAVNNAEQRALGNTGGVGGSAGEFAPPGWLLSDFVALARGGRVIADRCTKLELPSGVSSLNIPKFTGGTLTALQTSQNTAVSQVDPTTASLTSSIQTVAGKTVVSQQLIDQSGLALDQILLADLAADYSLQLDKLVISANLTGFVGILNVGSITQVAYTTGTPAVAGAGNYYATLQKAVSAVSTGRFLPPDCIAMHPRRWSWLAAAFDGQNRPLVSPTGGGVNSVATMGQQAAQGIVGEIAGLPVVTDPNLPINLGAGTNQDPTLVMRASDLFLWESGLTFASFDAPYSDSMGVLLRVHGYASFQGGRYPSSVSVVNGTGTITPVY
jgi:HK97 family phage major capsid protein